MRIGHETTPTARGLECVHDRLAASHQVPRRATRPLRAAARWVALRKVLPIAQPVAGASGSHQGMAGALVFACLAACALIALSVLAPITFAASSPRSGMIGYSYQLNRSTFQIGTVNPEGSGNKLSAEGRSQPKFSPDGNRMLVWNFSGSGAAAMYVRDVNGSRETGITLTSPGVVWDAAWSPDGSKIAYMLSAGGNAADAEVWVMNADGTSQVQITRDGLAKTATAIDWASTPSGSKIAYVGVGAGPGPCADWGLNIMNSDGTGATCVPTASDLALGGVADLAWSPDGTKLAVASNYCGSSDCGSSACIQATCARVGDLWLVDVSANSKRDLTTSHGFGDLHVYSVAWSADGDQLAVTGNIPSVDRGNIVARGAGVYLLPAAGGSAKRLTPVEPVDSTANISDVDWQACTDGVTKTCVTAPPASAGPPTVRAVSASYAANRLTVGFVVNTAAGAQVVFAEPGKPPFRSRTFRVTSGRSTLTVSHAFRKGRHVGTLTITTATGRTTKPISFAVR